MLGASGSGKTSLLRAFIGKGFNEEEGEGERGRVNVGKSNGKNTNATGDSLRGKGKSVVNCVEEGGGERYLVVSVSPRFVSLHSVLTKLVLIPAARVWIHV